MKILDLGTVHLITDRPGATPAPTPQPQPTPPMPPASPWQPRHSAKACGCGVLDGEDCDCAEFASQARTAARQPIFFDFRKPEAA